MDGDGVSELRAVGRDGDGEREVEAPLEPDGALADADAVADTTADGESDAEGDADGDAAAEHDGTMQDTSTAEPSTLSDAPFVEPAPGPPLAMGELRRVVNQLTASAALVLT